MLFFQPPHVFIEYDPLNEWMGVVSLVDQEVEMHHDLKRLPWGNYLSLDRNVRVVNDYPIDFSDPNNLADVDVIDDVVVEIDPYGYS